MRGSDLDSASFPSLQSARGIVFDERLDLASLKLVAKGGQLMPDQNWLDRLPEIEAEIATQVITLMNQSGDVSIPMQMSGDVSINMADAQSEYEAQSEAEELAAREIDREYGGYSRGH